MDRSAYATEMDYVRALRIEKERRKRTKYKVDHTAPTQNVVDWIESEFYIPERADLFDKAMKLAPYQKAVLLEAQRRDEDGKFIYDVVLWSDIKKSAKSTIAAAVVLYRALTTKRGRFRIVANDLKQADSRVFDFIRTAIELNPKLQARCHMRNYRIMLNNGSRIEAVPIDPKGEAGGNDDMIEFTELHAAQSKAAQLMWSEMTLSPLKHGYSQRWIDTYAGHSGESPILEPLYEKGVKDGRKLQLDNAPVDLEVFASGSMLTLWNTKPRLDWQTPEYYASEATVQTDAEYRRVHGNQWTSSIQSFVPIEWWDACKKVPVPAPDRYRELVIALDAAVSGDCFAIVAMGRDKNNTILRYARKWEPDTITGTITFTNADDPADTDYPEGELRRLCNEYNVLCVCYDPYQLHSFATNLKNEGLAYFEEFDQGTPRLVADKALWDCIRERTIIHGGESDLRDHINNANSTAEEKNTLRIVKRTNSKKIDLVVALSMANDRARFWLSE